MNILINVRDSKLVNITQGLTEFGKSHQQVTMSEYIHLRIIYVFPTILSFWNVDRRIYLLI